MKRKEDGLDQLKNGLQRHKQECEALKKSWLPELEKKVKEVDKKITKYFGSIKCRGETKVIAPENKEMYADYKLDIRVAFRPNQPLESLAVGRQSGGERSVATMLFLLAMPTSRCPFRLVDEINQVYIC